MLLSLGLNPNNSQVVSLPNLPNREKYLFFVIFYLMVAKVLIITKNKLLHFANIKKFAEIIGKAIVLRLDAIREEKPQDEYYRLICRGQVIFEEFRDMFDLVDLIADRNQAFETNQLHPSPENMVKWRGLDAIIDACNEIPILSHGI